VMMMNLEKLHLLTGDLQFREVSQKLENYFSPLIEQSPSAFTMFLSAVFLKRSPSFEITILGEKNKPDVNAFLVALRKVYLPNVVLIFKSNDDKLITEIIPSVEHKTIINQTATAYVCGNGTCQAPVNTHEDLINLLKE